MNFHHLNRYGLLSSMTGLVVVSTLVPLGFSTMSQATPVLTSNAAQQTVFTSDRYGFQFNYTPNQLVLVSRSSKSSGVSLLNAIDLWTKQDYQTISSNEFFGDHPPNVRVTVHGNPQQLALKQWIQQNDWIVDTKNFQERTIDGQKGLFFTSGGLYQQENLILKHPKNNTIILISFARTNSDRNVAVYQKAFNEVLQSFKLRIVSQS